MNFLRKSRVFYKLFIPFFLLGIGLVVGFSIFIYNSTYNSVEESFLKDKKNYTRQILNNVEQKVRTIEYGYTAYSSTSNFEQIFMHPMTEKDFETYRDIKKEMSYIEMIGIEGSKYSLVSLEQEWGIVDGSLKRLTTNQIAEYKDTYISSDTNGLFWKPTESGIEMVMALPMYKREKFALGISNIPRRSINQIVGDKNNLVEIYNKKDQLLYSNKMKVSEVTTETFKQFKEVAKGINGPDVLTTEDGKKYVFMQSEYNQWLYVVEIDEKEIGSIIHNTRVGLCVVSALLILLVGIISYLSSESFSRPIKKIQEKLAVHGVNQKQNELLLLADSVDKIVGQNKSLTTSLSMQKPQLETLFVLSLFRKRISEIEITNRLEQLGHQYKKEKVYYTGLIQMDNMEDQKIGDKNLFLLAINNLVEEVVPKEERLIPIVLNDEMQATIFILDNNDEEAERRIIKYYEHIQAAVKKSLNMVISVGISPEYHSLIDSKKAVDLAKESLHYRVNVGTESIIFYNDIASMLNEASISKFPVELLNELLNAIRSGDEEDVMRLVDLLVEEIFRLNKNPISLGVTLIRVINELVQLGQLLGAESKIFENIKKLYQAAINAYYPEKIKEMLIHDLVKPVIISTHDKTERGFKSLSDKIAYIVQTEYDQEISLEIIAERLHYNPNYLSNVFKKEHGENFVDYLMNYRLQMAQTWLKETDLAVKDIAERLQYRNSQNFIRFFKKKLGITPGDYRKEYTQ
ncbi:helix-turn-helix transcriptional regulator [Robertmurraya korlensis]|uniref:helix-turn-helix transcriptional regulator n=1 Tax=Robertmurraya korlensis TaxID=519977 RepID=UPI003F776DE3